MITSSQLTRIWSAFDDLLGCAELNQDSLEPETILAIHNAGKAARILDDMAKFLARIETYKQVIKETEQKLKELNGT